MATMSKVVLVTGGAGYIGSHASYLLHQGGYRVVIIDNFVHSQPYVCPWATLVRGDFAEQTILDHVFSSYQVDAIMHFAAFIEVGESVLYPQRFYENNVIKTLLLLNRAMAQGIKKFIFSSSCAVYGTPKYVPIDEHHPYDPISPYGKNKLTVEFALQDYAQAYGLRYVALRYFNAAGALLEKDLGEWHQPETHVIPKLMRAIIADKEFCIWGDDYQTVDGTCERDYVHVLDIAQAHVLAYEYLQKHDDCQVFNLGSGTGYTVKQLIVAAQNVCGKRVDVHIMARRPGDVPILVADNAKIKKMLGWQPCSSDLETMLAAAYAWEKRRMCDGSP